MISKNKIDIVHSHTHYTANIAKLASLISKTVTIQIVHGVIPALGFLPHYNADYFISVNRKGVNDLVGKKKKNENIFLVYNGVPSPDSTIKSDGALKILFASRQIPDKGTDIFVKAAAIVSKSAKVKISFLLAGEVECENDVRELIKELKADIQFLGKVENLNHLLRETHIFVFPSWYESEGFPVVFIEAAMNENLIITSPFLSLKDVFEENKECLVFYNNDPELLAQKILLAVNNYHKYDEMRRACNVKSEEIFGISKMVSDLKNIYHSLPF